MLQSLIEQFQCQKRFPDGKPIIVLHFAYRKWCSAALKSKEASSESSLMDGHETSLHEACSMPEKVDMFRAPGPLV